MLLFCWIGKRIKSHVLFCFVLLSFFLSGTIFAAAADTEMEPAVKIEIGSLSAPSDAAIWFEEQVDRFKFKYPHIAVDLVDVEEPKRPKFPLTENPPLARNVIGIDSELGYEIPYLVSRGMLVPIDDFLPDKAFDFSVFYDSDLAPVQYQGKTWAIPWLARTEVLVCNMPLFEKVGLTRPPKTWDELTRYAQRLTRFSHGSDTVQIGLRLGKSNDALAMTMLSFIMQKDGYVMRDGKFTLKHKSVPECVNYFRYLLTKSNAIRYNSQTLAEALEDEPSLCYGMHIVPIEEVAAVFDRKEFTFSSIPMEGKKIQACRKRLYLAIRKSSEAEENASWLFVRSFASPSIHLPARPAGFPCVRTIVKRNDFKILFNYAANGIETLFTTAEFAVDYGEPVVNRIPGFEALWPGLVPVLEGRVQLSEVADTVVFEANRIIKPISYILEE